MASTAATGSSRKREPTLKGLQTKRIGNRQVSAGIGLASTVIANRVRDKTAICPPPFMRTPAAKS
ncbi:MAG UNVERIFIED_CONTAM: hypothetical protein LVR18_00610 [Planctomycetaceae bacterium]